MSHEYKLNDEATLYWLSHASFKIRSGSEIIYIDPFEIEDDEAADIILITHAHYDHCSISDVRKIAKEKTLIIAPQDCEEKLSELVHRNLKTILPGQKIEVNNVTIEAVAAYNIGKQFHPKENNWVGYIINISGTKVYHAGDTDLIPEMNNVKADVALLPVGGTYTMDAVEASKACDAIKPKVAIPMHYNKIVGTMKSAEDFKKLAKCEVKII